LPPTPPAPSDPLTPSAETGSGAAAAPSSRVVIPVPPNWTPPQKTLVVIGSQRSGSTLLCGLMAQTDRLGRPDEFFKKAPYPHWEIQADSIQRRCQLALEEGTSSNGVCGIKLFGSHFQRLQSQIDLFRWFPHPFFVWIRRRDALGQAISASIARQTGRYRSFYDDRGITPEYSTEDITARLEWAALDEASWRVFLSRTAVPFHELYYEDLVKAPQEHVRAIAAAAGIEEGHSFPTIELVPMAVQRTETNALWRARYLAECGDPNFIETELKGKQREKWWKRRRLYRWFKRRKP
jgi:trehalose 2-sulfotransferase